MLGKQSHLICSCEQQFESPQYKLGQDDKFTTTAQLGKEDSSACQTSGPEKRQIKGAGSIGGWAEALMLKQQRLLMSPAP